MFYIRLQPLNLFCNPPPQFLKNKITPLPHQQHSLASHINFADPRLYFKVRE